MSAVGRQADSACASNHPAHVVLRCGAGGEPGRRCRSTAAGQVSPPSVERSHRRADDSPARRAGRTRRSRRRDRRRARPRRRRPRARRAGRRPGQRPLARVAQPRLGGWSAGAGGVARACGGAAAGGGAGAGGAGARRRRAAAPADWSSAAGCCRAGAAQLVGGGAGEGARVSRAARARARCLRPARSWRRCRRVRLSAAGAAGSFGRLRRNGAPAGTGDRTSRAAGGVHRNPHRHRQAGRGEPGPATRSGGQPPPGALRRRLGRGADHRCEERLAARTGRGVRHRRRPFVRQQPAVGQRGNGLGVETVRRTSPAPPRRAGPQQVRSSAASRSGRCVNADVSTSMVGVLALM